MDLLSTPVVSAAKLPIEQYFLMTDYSLWEVIINGDSPSPTVVVDGFVQPVTILSADQKLAKRNELKACGTLLMALPDKHQLKFNSHKDAKTLMEAIENALEGTLKLRKLQKLVSQLGIHRVSLSQEDVNLKFLCSLPSEWKTHTLIWRNKANLEEHSLDDLFKSLKIYETKVRNSSSQGNPTQNLAFMLSSNTDSTTDSIAMLTMRARRFLYKTGRNLGDNKVTTIGFDMSKVECYNCHRKGHFTRECRSYDWSYQSEEEPANFALMAITSSCSSFNNETNNKQGLGYFSSESDSERLSPSCPSDSLQPSGGYNVVPSPITGNFMPPKPNLVFHTAPIAVETDHSAFTVQPSPAKPTQDLSHTTRPMAPIIEDWVSDPEDESEPNDPHSVPSFVHISEHVNLLDILSVDHLIKDCNFYAKPKAQPTSRNYAHRGYNKQKASFTQKHPQKQIVSAAVLTKSKPVSVTVVRQVSAVVPKIMVTRPRHAYSLTTNSKSTFKRHIPRSQSPKTSNSPPKVTAGKASVVCAAKGKKGKWGNLQYALKDKEVIDSGYSRHMTRNMSYLSDFQELNGRYVTFGGNPNGCKISSKGKIKTGKLDFEDVYFVKELKFNLFSVSQMCDKKNKVLFTDSECLVLSPNFKLPDESQVLLRVPRENNMYNVNLKDMIPFRDLTCLFAKATIDESNLWHRRLGHINFRTINKLVKGNLVRGLPTKFLKIIIPVLLVRNASIIEPLETNLTPVQVFKETLIQKKKERKLINNMCFFLCGLLVLQILKTKKEMLSLMKKEHDAEKPKSAVNLSLSSSALSREQDDMAKKKDKGKIPTAGQNYSNIINPFSVAGPSNTNTSPTHGKPSLKVASQLYDNSDILEMEGIAYSDHENVGAEANFNNLKTSITDERGIVVRNKARLVDQGYTQEEGINYEEVFASVARIKAIRLFLAYASFIGFMVYQMDVKSAFLYGTIEEKVYVCQPPGFEDPDHPDKVYKVVKALYGLHQALRAWYETLANYLLENSFYRGQIDQTLFIKKQKGDILLVQIYVKQKKDGIFISQDKYVAKILKKFRLTKGKSASTPIDTEKPLLKDPNENLQLEDVNSLDADWFLGNARSKQLLPLHPQSYIEYALTVNPTIYVSCIKQFWNTVAVKQSKDVTRLQALVDKKKVVVTEATIRDALRLDDVEGVDCLPNEEIFTELARMGYEKSSTKLTFYKAFFSSQ
nr:putative ribonuclease H-like domain-containing protein [Tanacetum cinerariifolium]